MSGNLPPGFTEKVWEGWENCPCKRNPCNSILRKLANGRTLRVWRYDNPKVSWRVHLDSDWGDGETFSTEQAAADWANRYAAENGGWA